MTTLGPGPVDASYASSCSIPAWPVASASFPIHGGFSPKVPQSRPMPRGVSRRTPLQNVLGLRQANDDQQSARHDKRCVLLAIQLIHPTCNFFVPALTRVVEAATAARDWLQESSTVRYGQVRSGTVGTIQRYTQAPVRTIHGTDQVTLPSAEYQCPEFGPEGNAAVTSSMSFLILHTGPRYSTPFRD
ncbi:predicted protein [Histoplasma capsulatum var. duboisii H88]|uniref:Predicted protein n=1 Tax=Ajellomyces capsulatus (strain H88) TaxID=544711 RepID=F0U9U4_AJEC8|nr:predicted protein [Histoplasma capsulatum var. duboisii H88]